MCLCVQYMQTVLCQVGYDVKNDYNENPEYVEPILDYDYIVKKPDPLVCFTCHYSRSQGHDQGMRNCDEPFREDGIPTIQCYGSCAITNTSSGHDDYMIVRSCLPNCKDITDPASSVKCCSSDKCNGRTVRNNDAVIMMGTGSMLVTMAILCVLWCYRKS